MIDGMPGHGKAEGRKFGPSHRLDFARNRTNRSLLETMVLALNEKV
jgi:hypothetical protein